ncbi:MAG TPA: ParB N-terminal domain-containing protein [Actinomycetes bacterium]|nr:ParB N-terminal domain-containing protein [Actinomycetes bacterium]
MAWTLLLYVAVCAIPVALFWLAGRLVGLDRPFRGPTGRTWLDAEDAFDRARRQHERHRLAAALRGRRGGLDLPTLREEAILGLGGSRNPSEEEIPICEIVGATDGADGKFDRDFLPTDERSRWRFQAIVIALREGQALPPIEVYRLHGRYYVSDGHHRVAATRALGERSINAYVTEIPG